MQGGWIAPPRRKWGTGTVSAAPYRSVSYMNDMNIERKYLR